MKTITTIILLLLTSLSLGCSQDVKVTPIPTCIDYANNVVHLCLADELCAPSAKGKFESEDDFTQAARSECLRHQLTEDQIICTLAIKTFMEFMENKCSTLR